MMEKCVLIACFMSLVLRSVASASIVDVGSTTSGDNGTGTSTGTGTGTDTGTSGTGTDNDYGVDDLPDNCTWAPWGDCSVTCGVGTRVRFIYSHCDGVKQTDRRDEQSCDNPICSGSWSPWNSWTYGPCSVTCGVGIQKFTRERQCSTEGECIGDHSEQKQLDCKNLQPCQGAWSPWSPWINGTCSVTCGDGKHTSTQIRNCLITGPCTGVGMEHTQLDCNNLPDCY